MANLNSYRNAYTASGGYLTDVTGQSVTSMQGINVSGAADGDFLVYANSTTIVNESAATARSSLGVDASGTDNSTNVTVSGTYDYITISGQVITRNLIDLSTDVSGLLPSSSLPTTYTIDGGNAS